MCCRISSPDGRRRFGFRTLDWRSNNALGLPIGLLSAVRAFRSDSSPLASTWHPWLAQMPTSTEGVNSDAFFQVVVRFL